MRRYPRAKLFKGLLVAWQSGSQRVVSRVTTVSLGGVFINTSNPAPVGTILKLIFTVPQGEVQAVAAVRSSEPGRGMGAQFTSMSYPDRARLHRLLKQTFDAENLSNKRPKTR